MGTGTIEGERTAGMGIVRRPRHERRNLAARERLVQRVIAEFREMPDLRLTSGEAERLFGLRADVCGRLIDRLMHDGLLRRDAEGRYATV